MNDDDTVEDVEELLRQARADRGGETGADDEETIDVDPQLLRQLRSGSAPGLVDDDVTVVADRARLVEGEPDPVAGVAHPSSAAPSRGGVGAWRVVGVVVGVLVVFVGGWWAATAFTDGSGTEVGGSAVDDGPPTPGGGSATDGEPEDAGGIGESALDGDGADTELGQAGVDDSGLGSPTGARTEESIAAAGNGSVEVPATTVPATTVPATTVPVTTTVPATTVPVTTVPATTVPATTVPVTTVPATTVPATTVPATTVPATTVPVTTTVPVGLPGEGVDVVAGRATWMEGYFLAELYKQLLQELGYNVSDPAEAEVGRHIAYEAVAQGEMDYWPNSWYPADSVWLSATLPDGSRVGDHVSVVGEAMIAGGLSGFLVTKSFADEYGVYTMDELNRNAEALAAFDVTDPVPGNGVADIFGCPEAWLCDDIIKNQIAFSGWDNIARTRDGYDAMFFQALDNVNEGVPMVLWAWTPTMYIALLRPGDRVYWLGVDEILDNSNPTGQQGGENHSQRGADGSGGFASIGSDQCPSAADEPSGRCKIGWLSSDILVTANSGFLAANPAARALFEAVRLPMIDVSVAALYVMEVGESPTDLAAQWIADNRDLVDEWIAAALAAA